MSARVERGAYGLQVRTSPVAIPDLTAPAGDWADVHVRVDVRAGRGAAAHALDDERATVVIAPGMRAEIDRASRTATLVTAEEWPAGALAHPFLAAPGMIFGWWEGREALHGGAFVAGRGAWAVLGEKGAGKSTLLGSLASAGAVVVADDLVVVRDGLVLAGPRGVDLTPEAAEAVGAGEATGHARATKLRMPLGPVAPETPLLGFIHLEWGETLDLAPLPVAERAARIARHRSVTSLAPRTAGGMLDLIALPSHVLRRPRDLALLPRIAERLLGLGG